MHLAEQEIHFLGHSVSTSGIKILPDRISTIRDYPSPRDLRELRHLLGTVGFCARFVRNYSSKCNVHCIHVLVCAV